MIGKSVLNIEYSTTTLGSLVSSILSIPQVTVNCVRFLNKKVLILTFKVKVDFFKALFTYSKQWTAIKM